MSAITPKEMSRDELEARIAKLEDTVRSLLAFDSYNMEYDGRMYAICPSCGVHLSDGDQHKNDCDFILGATALQGAAKQ